MPPAKARRADTLLLFFEYVINIIRLLLCGGDSLVKVSRLAVDASVDIIAYFLIDFTFIISIACIIAPI